MNKELLETIKDYLLSFLLLLVSIILMYFVVI